MLARMDGVKDLFDENLDNSMSLVAGISDTFANLVKSTYLYWQKSDA
jgi:hypothetical protein